jgi:hypothetical protein
MIDFRLAWINYGQFPCFFFPAGRHPNSGLRRLIVEGSRSHTIRQTHSSGRTPLKEWSAHAQHATNTWDEHPRFQGDSNPRSQKSSGCRHSFRLHSANLIGPVSALRRLITIDSAPRGYVHCVALLWPRGTCWVTKFFTLIFRLTGRGREGGEIQ